jgi:hypothetical protein
MPDEQRRDDDEVEVEGHVTEVRVQDEPAEEGEPEVEAHVQRTPSVRME